MKYIYRIDDEIRLQPRDEYGRADYWSLEQIEQIPLFPDPDGRMLDNAEFWPVYEPGHPSWEAAEMHTMQDAYRALQLNLNTSIFECRNDL